MQTWEARLMEKLIQGVPTRPQEGPVAAVALILRERAGLEVLLIERVEKEGDPWSGQIALPGGRMDPQDATPLDTVRRETMEEVSIDLDGCCRRLGRLPEMSPVNVPELAVFPFVYSLRVQVEAKAGEEAQEAFWAPITSLRRSRTSAKVRVRGTDLEVPAFACGGRTVWGLTFRILSALLEKV